MFDFLDHLIKWITQLVKWLRPSIEIEVSYFKFEESWNNPSSSIAVFPPRPDCYHAKVALTNRSDRAVYIKSISVTINEEKPVQDIDSGTVRIDSHERIEKDPMFQAHSEEKPITAGNFRIEVIPTVGRGTSISGTFPHE